MKSVLVNLDAETLSFLKGIAERRGVSRSQYLRALLYREASLEGAALQAERKRGRPRKAAKQM